MENLLEKQREKQEAREPKESLLGKLKRLFKKTPVPEENTSTEAAEEPAPQEESLEANAAETPAEEIILDEPRPFEEQEDTAEEVALTVQDREEELPVKVVRVVIPGEEPVFDLEDELFLSETEELSPEELGLSDPGEIVDFDLDKLDQLDEEPDLEESNDQGEDFDLVELDFGETDPEEPENQLAPMEPAEPIELPEEAEIPEIPDEPEAEEPEAEKEEPVSETEEKPEEAESVAPPQEDAPAAEEQEITSEEIEQIKVESLPEKEPETAEVKEKAKPEEIPEKYTLATWWEDNCHRCFAVFITAILLTMTLAIHSDLLVSVSVYQVGHEEPALSRVSIEHDLDQLLADAGFVWQDGDGYRWSGYGEDHRATLIYCPQFTVTILSKLDGDEQFTTNAVVEKSLRQMLEERGYEFGELDYMEPDFSTVPLEDVTLTIHRVEVRDYEETRVIPYETVYKETSLFYRNKNRQLKTIDGKDGEALYAVHERYVDGEQVDYTDEIVETITEPVNEIIKVYGAKAPVSDMEGPPIVNGKPEGWNLVLTGRATGYSAGRTYRRVKGASGMWLTYGYVAVNPRQIPYGTKLYIVSQDGNFVYGYCIAADTGIALMEGIIVVDLFYDTFTESAINAVWNVNIYAEP